MYLKGSFGKQVVWVLGQNLKDSNFVSMGEAPS